ncbi:MAG TPA: hypothetical protein VKP69_19725, partial [Isosphaeraceae bacterium]|nr:hypothetical protein [Isosphaeraceae bacterium]
MLQHLEPYPKSGLGLGWHRAPQRLRDWRGSTHAAWYTGDAGFKQYPTLERLLSTFRVAAELSELYHAHGFEHMMHALLSEAARDSGLMPSETAKQIRDGVAHARRQA